MAAGAGRTRRADCRRGNGDPPADHGHQHGWTFNFIVSLTFLVLIDALGRTGAFWLYGAIGVFTLWFCWELVPETRDKTLAEIQGAFEERARVGGRTRWRPVQALRSTSVGFYR